MAFIVAVAALAAYSLPRLEVRTEILDFLPDAGDRQLAELSRHVAASDLNRTVTLTITGRDVDESARAARVLGDALREADEVRWVRTGPTEDLQRAFYEVYFPHRFALLGDEDTARRLFAPGALEARARELRSRLGSPAGAFVRRIATDDPWLAFLHHVEALSSSQQGELAVHDGVFVTREADQAADEDAEGASDVTTVPSGVVLFASEHSPFNAAASGRLLAQLDRALNETRETIGAELSVEQASVHRIAHASEGAIRADIQRVSIAGTLGVLLLLLVLFRSPRAIFLGGLPLALGMLLAISISQLVFGAIHGLTLAFGATLIGVAIDYVAHLLNHHYLAPSADGAAGSLRRIRVGLVLGAGTTIVGLSGLAWTSFPGIRQMAVFTCVGVAGALVATIIVLPPLLPDAPRATPVHRALAAGVDRMLVALSSRRRALVALPLLAIAIAIVGVPQLDWQDDIRALSELDAEMSEEDARVRARVARMEAGRFVVATGTNLQAALERNDDVAAALAAANEAGEVASFRSLRGLLPSAATQRASLEAIPDDAAERTFAALESEGFVREPFAPLAEALRGARDGSVLTLADLDGTPLEMLARTFVIPLDEGDDAPVAVLSYVTGVSDAAALARRVEAIEGVRFFDQAAFMSRAYRDFRNSHDRARRFRVARGLAHGRASLSPGAPHPCRILARAALGGRDPRRLRRARPTGDPPPRRHPALGAEHGRRLRGVHGRERRASRGVGPHRREPAHGLREHGALVRMCSR